MISKIRAVLIIPLVVALLLSFFSGLGYLVGCVLGIPNRLGIPLWLRLLGLLCLSIGFAFLAWVFRHRPAMEILASTYATLASTLAGDGKPEGAPRTEPLIITGPHRFVRHPLYSAVVLLMVGWWLILDLTFLAFCAGFMALWFSLVVAPFEERELRTLFGEQYDRYTRTTPRFIPSSRRQNRIGLDK